jgi:hypothetical protein
VVFDLSRSKAANLGYDLICPDGKQQTLAMIWSVLMEINKLWLWFDQSRSKAATLDNDLIEKLKDGFAFSGKYKCEIRYFDPVPKIVVFLNTHPKVDKLSHDRVQVFTPHQLSQNVQDRPDAIQRQIWLGSGWTSVNENVQLLNAAQY